MEYSRIGTCPIYPCDKYIYISSNFETISSKFSRIDSTALIPEAHLKSRIDVRLIIIDDVGLHSSVFSDFGGKLIHNLFIYTHISYFFGRGREVR